MTQIFFPPSPEVKQQKTYCYTNNHATVVVVKLKCLDDRHCERVIFPAEKFLFTAEDSCEIEIHQQTNIGIIKDTIACDKLKVIDS